HAYGTMSERHMYLVGTLAQAPDLLARLAGKRELITATMSELEWRLASLLEQGKAAGQFDPAIPTPVMLSMFTSVLAPHAYRRLVVRGGMTCAEAIGHMSRLYFEGIAADAQPSDDDDAQPAPQAQ